MFPCPKMVRWSNAKNHWDVKVLFLSEQNETRQNETPLTQINPAVFAIWYHPENRRPIDVLCTLKLSREQEEEHIPHPTSSVSAVLLPLGTVDTKGHICRLGDNTVPRQWVWRNPWKTSPKELCSTAHLREPVHTSSAQLLNIPLLDLHEHLSYEQGILYWTSRSGSDYLPLCPYRDHGASHY